MDDERGVAAASRDPAEERAQQRAVLLDAAAQVFATSGFAGSSAELVAAAAGLPVDALHAQFAGMDELLLAVMTSRVDERLAEAGWLVETVATDRADAAAAMSRLLIAVADKDIDTAALQAELWLYAVRNPEAQARLAVQSRGFDMVVANVVRAQFARYDPGVEVPAESLATVLTALFEGMVLRRRIDPDAVPEDLFGRALQWLVAGVRATARPPG